MHCREAGTEYYMGKVPTILQNNIILKLKKLEGTPNKLASAR